MNSKQIGKLKILDKESLKLIKGGAVAPDCSTEDLCPPGFTFSSLNNQCVTA